MTQLKTCKTCDWWIFYVFPTDKELGYCSCRESPNWHKVTNDVSPCDKYTSNDRQREMGLEQ